MTERRAANAARVRALTVGLAVAGAVGTAALGGLAWAQDNADEADSTTTSGQTSTSQVTSDGTSSASSPIDSSTTTSTTATTWPQVTSGSSSSSHTRTVGS